MITTRKIKTKETLDEKVTIITTGGVKPQLFNPRGKSKSFDERMITTSNVAIRKRELEKDMKRIKDKRERDERKAKQKELKKKAKEEKEMIAREKKKAEKEKKELK